MKGIWKLILLFYNFSVSLKLQSILIPAVKFYEAWLMLEWSSLVHRFSPKHALQPSCAQEYYAHTLQHCSLGPLYIAKSPRKPPHQSLENVALNRLWQEHLLAVLSWDKKARRPPVQPQQGTGHIRWCEYLNHLHACRMTGKAQGLIWQLQISAMDEFTYMESVNNEDGLTVLSK